MAYLSFLCLQKVLGLVYEPDNNILFYFTNLHNNVSAEPTVIVLSHVFSLVLLLMVKVRIFNISCSYGIMFR